MTAAVLGESKPPPAPGILASRFAYQVRDASGRVLLRSANAPPICSTCRCAQGSPMPANGAS